MCSCAQGASAASLPHACRNAPALCVGSPLSCATHAFLSRTCACLLPCACVARRPAPRWLFGISLAGAAALSPAQAAAAAASQRHQQWPQPLLDHGGSSGWGRGSGSGGSGGSGACMHAQQVWRSPVALHPRVEIFDLQQQPAVCLHRLLSTYHTCSVSLCTHHTSAVHPPAATPGSRAYARAKQLKALFDTPF